MSMSHDEMIAVIAAQRDGNKIERKWAKGGMVIQDKWVEYIHPFFNFADWEYRIKPEPPKPREWTLRVCSNIAKAHQTENYNGESGHHYPAATVKHETLSDGSEVWNIHITATDLYATSNRNAERHCRRINSAIGDAILGVHPIDDDSDDLFAPRERDLLNHEEQTHAELGAILGTDDSLRECAKRMRDALAQLLKWIDCGCDPSTKSLDAARSVLAKGRTP